MASGDLQIAAAAEGPDDKNHACDVGAPDFKRLADLWPEVVVRLRVIKYVDSCDASEDI